MPTPEHEAYRKGVLLGFRARAADPDIAAQLELHMKAAAILWELDLSPAKPLLQGCYAANPRGGDPWDPLLMLRVLLLMLLVGQASINKWVPILTASRVLRILAGLPEDDRPGVATLYDFMDRLHDGPIRVSCEHVERPSEAQRRRAATARPLQRNEPKPPKPTSSKRGKKKGRKGDKVAVEAPAVIDASVTEKLIAELRVLEKVGNPNDLLGRLAAILVEVGVKGSMVRGLLGDVAKLSVAGDGSSLPTGGSRYGKKNCGHPKSVKCECPRIFSDPDARMGYDSYRDLKFFGYHFYEIIVNFGGHDLPLAIRLDPGNATDYTASVLTLDRLFKDLPSIGVVIHNFIADAGHDSEANHRYCMDHGLRTVIPMRGKAPAKHPDREAITLSPRGIPTCQAHAEMASRGSAGTHRNIFVCPVKAGTLKTCPLAPAEDPRWLCRPEQKFGPTVVVDARWNPRLCPPIPRNSKGYKTLYNLRSGCERSNSAKKEVFKLEDARHRRASFWLIRLHLIAVLQHARVWVDDGAARNLVDLLLGREPARQPA